MRVCFPFVGDSIGGSHISALLLIEEIRNRGIEPLVVLHQESDLASELKRRGLKYHLIPLSFTNRPAQGRVRYLLGLLASFLKLFTFLIRHQLDIVHTNDVRMHNLWSPVVQIFRTRHVWHQRTVFPCSRFTRWSFRFTDSVISISEFVEQSLPSVPGSIRQVIPNPVAPPHGRSWKSLDEVGKLRSFLLSGREFVVGSFGSLTSIKRPDVLLESGRLLQRMLGRPISLVIFGDDKEGYAKKLSLREDDLGGDFSVRYFGLKRPVEPWMSACDLILATSERDGFGRTLIEAMSLGVPVVATDAGGHREVIEHGITGLLAGKNDPKAIAAAAHRVLTEEEMRKRLIKSGLELAREKFHPKRHADNVLEVYWKLRLN